MRKLILLSMNQMASCLLQEAAEYTPVTEDVFSCTAQTFHSTALQCEGHETVILCDIWNSPASQTALEWLKNQKGLLLSGMNLPMVIAAITFKDAVDHLQKLEKTLAAEAASSIKGIIL